MVIEGEDAKIDTLVYQIESSQVHTEKQPLQSSPDELVFSNECSVYIAIPKGVASQINFT